MKKLLVPSLFSLMAAFASTHASASLALVQKSACIGCHAVDKKLVGPSFQDMAKRYEGQADAAAHFVTVIKKGGSGKWGAIPMPAQPAVSDADAKQIADWILSGAK